MTASLLTVQDLTLTLCSGRRRKAILRNVGFEVHEGELLGLVGESGSGKSMTARSLIRLLPAGATLGGSVRYRGREVLSMPAAELRMLRGTEVAMVFQDARAHMSPVRKIGDYLTEGLIAIGRTSRAEAARRAVELLTQVHVDRPQERMGQFPHELSGGLLQRVMIAGALAAEPSLLIADEPTTALDVTTQAEVMAILLELRERRALAIVFITHDLELAAATCDRTAVMYAGRIVEVQPSALLHQAPRHPYTAGLLRSRPSLEASGRFFQLPGRPPEEIDVAGCPFAPRCSYATEPCLTIAPPIVPLADGHAVCHRVGEVDLAAVTPGQETVCHG